MRLTTLSVLILLVINSLTVSCKKKDKKPTDPPPTTSTCDTTYIDNYINDTIFPSEYLMTYPGSEWNYDNGTSVICDQWENVAHCTYVHQDCDYTVTRDYHILPHCTSEPFYISYNTSIDVSYPILTGSLQLLDTIVGVFYEDHYYEGTWQYGWNVYRSMEVVEKLESMEVLSVTYQDVIHIRKDLMKYAASEPVSHPYTYDYYYAKNIGLIKYTYNPHDAPITTKNLVSYTIGPH